MTPRDAVMARLGRSPATLPDVYDALVNYSDVKRDSAYVTALEILTALIDSGDVEEHKGYNFLLYRLTTRQVPNNTATRE